MRTRLAAGVSFFLALALLGGCSLPWLQPAQSTFLRLRVVSFADLENWRDNDPRAALAAFRRSCIVLAAKPDAEAMGGAGYAGTVADWRAPCAAIPSNPQDGAAARAFLENWFVPAEIGAGPATDGLFTGYYEPEIRASREKQGAFQTPVYGMPADLIDVDLGAFRPTLKGERIAGRLDGKHLVPYARRAEIDANGLPTAPILFYTNDPVSLFFLHIQGSGRARFDDGTVERINYAGANGRIYTAIGHTLIEQGALKREDVSLQSIQAWLKANPAAAQAVMETDESFVFFKEEKLGDETLGGTGAEGVALTPGASMAIDPRLHPFGALYFVATTMPGGAQTLDKLMVAQDIGGAIRGAVRGDLFWGFGAEAQNLAGQMKQPGHLYVLLPKPVAERLGGQADFPDGTL